MPVDPINNLYFGVTEGAGKFTYRYYCITRVPSYGNGMHLGYRTETPTMTYVIAHPTSSL